jgi:hypothetical protein
MLPPMSARRWRSLGPLVSVGGPLLVAGCVELNPSHCANLQGDATCAEQDAGLVCSRCAGANDGCVAQIDDPSCAAPQGADGGTDPGDDGSADSGDAGPSPTAGPGDDGPGDDDGTETNGPSDTGDPPTPCALEGTADPACPARSPFCVEGECAACDAAGGDEACAKLDASTPVCNVDRASCSACTPTNATQCPPATPACGSAFACVQCTEHADCASGACDLVPSTCIDASVVWVDNGDPSCPAGGDGSVDSPLCTLAPALSGIASEGSGVIMLVGGGSPYVGGVVIGGGRDVAIIGVGTPAIQVVGAAIDVSGSSRLLLAGARVRNADIAIECTNSDVVLDDATVATNAAGIVADGCDVVLRRSWIVGQTGDGIALTGGSLSSRSSVVGGNGDAGIRSDGAALNLAFTTVATNATAGVICEGTANRHAHASAFVSAAGDSIACDDFVVDESLLDTAGIDGEGQAQAPAYEATWFSNVDLLDFHLRRASGSPFGDVAFWREGDPFGDLDRDPIPLALGVPAFAGADQP